MRFPDIPNSSYKIVFIKFPLIFLYIGYKIWVNLALTKLSCCIIFDIRKYPGRR
jgi:hypothetical protein